MRSGPTTGSGGTADDGLADEGGVPKDISDAVSRICRTWMSLATNEAQRNFSSQLVAPTVTRSPPPPPSGLFASHSCSRFDETDSGDIGEEGEEEEEAAGGSSVEQSRVRRVRRPGWRGEAFPGRRREVALRA